MTDLSQIIADLCAGLEDVGTPSFSGFSETVSGQGNRQLIDKNISFWSFQPFRSENDTPSSDDASRSENVDFSAAAHARASSYVLEPERPERPEIASYPPLETGLSFFPVKDSQPERPEIENPVAGVFPPPGDPLPISPADIRAGVAREMRALVEDGREGPGALRDAVEITRAKIRNSEALAERQANGAACHVCDRPLDDTLPVVAVLSGKPGRALHMHAECCPAYSARRAALVDRIIAAAGYAEFLEAATREGAKS